MRNSISLLALLVTTAAAQDFRPDIPRTWDDQAVETFELPLAQRDRSPRYMKSAEYYALTPRTIYRSYPMYAPGREPVGYREWLLNREPEIIFDPANLKTKEDWIKAGKIVFDSGGRIFPAPDQPEVDPLLPISPEGILPYFRPGYTYIIRKKGVLEIQSNACANCHVRIMPDGSFIYGAQGVKERPATPEQIARLEELPPSRLAQRKELDFALFGVPWLQSKEAYLRETTRERLLQVLKASHPGTMARQGTSAIHQVRVPSLVGVQDLKYLDATGLVRHRSIADLMRYAVINTGLDTLAHFGDFQPSPGPTPFSNDPGMRYSDEQLYAVALYIYSLKPPSNPNPVNDLSRHGQRIFQQQGCAGCHTPPFYTNNKLTPALGFTVTEDLRKTDDILDVCVGTDPNLALATRRGTGFYKVPSLRGVWYRSAFGHAGHAETLEEWLDPARLTDGYVPKGFHIEPGPIKGHEFGLKLSPADKTALIAFLKTL
jgi:hypothetical protein